MQTLKIPQGLLKVVNNKGLYSDLLFYYQLKSLTKIGVIHKNNLIQLIQSQFQISESSIWRKIRRLVDLKILVKTIKTYRLVSYVNFYKIIDSTQGKQGNSCKKRYIFKIKTDFNNLKEKIAYEEIKLNLKRQEFKVRELMGTKVPIPFQSIENRMLEETNSILTLSCKGLATLLGYKALSTGWAVEQKLKKMGVLKIEPQKIAVEADHFLAGCNMRIYKQRSPKYVYYKHKIHYFEANQLQCIDK